MKQKPIAETEARALMAKFIPPSEPKTQALVMALMTGAPIRKADMDAAMNELVGAPSIGTKDRG